MQETNKYVCYCYICYGLTEPEFLCDTCNRYYCEDCSYMFSLHYQFQGCRCYQCADQYKRIINHIKDSRSKKIIFSLDINGIIAPNI